MGAARCIAKNALSQLIALLLACSHLHPRSAGVGPTISVELGVVLELAAFRDVPGVVGVLLGLLLAPDGVVLSGGETGRDVRLALADLANLAPAELEVM